MLRILRVLAHPVITCKPPRIHLRIHPLCSIKFLLVDFPSTVSFPYLSLRSVITSRIYFVIFKMAPLGQKLLSVFGLVAAFQSSLVAARNIDHDLVYSTDLLNLLP